MGVQRDLAKETEFLSGLYICPQCSHPHPKPFEKCPACGAHPSESLVARETPVLSTPSTGAFYIDDNEPVAEFTNAADVPPTEPMIKIQSPGSSSSADPDAETEKPRKKKDNKETTSPISSVRSFLSKLTRK